MNNYMMQYGGGLGYEYQPDVFGFCSGWVLTLLIIWSLIWKGLALWKAARSGSRNWFTVLLVVQTLGILEIVYLYIFSQPKAPAIKKRSDAGARKTVNEVI